jgi:TRAP-type C4-dicarboxylate transport system substrate-binding protein
MYAFRDRDHFRKFLSSHIFQEAEQNWVKKHGFRTISTHWTYDRGPYRVFVSRTPVIVPEDVKGMKMRIMPAEIPRLSWMEMGAAPIVIEWAETYMALKTGIADAVTTPISSLWPMKFTEVLKYVTKLDQFPQSVAVLVSEKKWKTLSTGDKQTIIDAVNEGGKYFTKLCYEGAERDIQRMLDQHGAVFMRVSLKPWRKKMKSIIRDFEKRGILPEGLYDRVQAIK